MVTLNTTFSLSQEDPMVLFSILLFVALIIYFLVKFFSILFDFFQAKGCLAVGLIALAGLPGVVVLSLLTGYTVAATILIVFAIVGLVTGYIALDSEGNVGKFGLFILIVSAITLVIAFLLKALGIFK